MEEAKLSILKRFCTSNLGEREGHEFIRAADTANKNRLQPLRFFAPPTAEANSFSSVYGTSELVPFPLLSPRRCLRTCHIVVEPIPALLVARHVPRVVFEQIVQVRVVER